MVMHKVLCEMHARTKFKKYYDANNNVTEGKFVIRKGVMFYNARAQEGSRNRQLCWSYYAPYRIIVLNDNSISARRVDVPSVKTN